jgi:hypothetical protein
MRLDYFAIFVYIRPINKSDVIRKRCIHIAEVMNYYLLEHTDIISSFSKIVLSLEDVTEERVFSSPDSFVTHVRLPIDNRVKSNDYDIFFRGLTSQLKRMQEVLFDAFEWRAAGLEKAIQTIITHKNRYRFQLNSLSLATKDMSKRVDVYLNIEETSIGLQAEVFNRAGELIATHSLVDDAPAYVVHGYLESMKSEFRDNRFVLYWRGYDDIIADIE